LQTNISAKIFAF